MKSECGKKSYHVKCFLSHKLLYFGCRRLEAVSIDAGWKILRIRWNGQQSVGHLATDRAGEFSAIGIQRLKLGKTSVQNNVTKI